MVETEWQWHYVERDYPDPASRTATFRRKLPVREQISVIEVEAKATVTTPHWDESIIDALEKIEVLADGTKVLYSMIPETASFIHFATVRSIPLIKRMDSEGETDKFTVKIPFGRWQRDTEYMLDTSQYKNVYLEIPWTLPTTFASDTMNWTIRYLRPIQPQSPAGFIRTRDIDYNTYTWTSTGWTIHPLPLKYPWYMIGYRYYDIDRDMFTDLDQVVLDVDDGRFVIVEDDTDDLLTVNTERLPYPIHVPHKLVHTSPATGSQLRSYLGHIDEVSVKEASPEFKMITDCPVNGQRIFLKAGPSPGTGALVQAFVNVSLWGAAYMCCMVVKDWWRTWFDPTPHAPFPAGEHSEAELRFHHTVPAGVTLNPELRIFLQEVCPLGI